jgi:hypothetical protein
MQLLTRTVQCDALLTADVKLTILFAATTHQHSLTNSISFGLWNWVTSPKRRFSLFSLAIVRNRLWTNQPPARKMKRILSVLNNTTSDFEQGDHSGDRTPRLCQFLRKTGRVDLHDFGDAWL